MRTKIFLQKKSDGTGPPGEMLVGWGKLINCFCLGLLYAILLAYAGFFNPLFLFVGFLVIAFLGGFFDSITHLFINFFLRDFDFLRFLMVIAWIIWFVLLLIYSPFPAFSGRDEGSYANAAIYLARYHSLDFQLPLEGFFKEEGLSHQLLNYPGFVSTSNGMTSQFSPGYFVLLGIFYLFAKTTAIFSLINGLLILGGGVAFYFLIRLFAPRWFALAGTFALMFNFLFLWFPRFTLSENLAFMLFINLVFFLSYYKKVGNWISAYPIIALLILFPLTRPEGWWLLIASLVIMGFWYFKGQIGFGRRSFLKYGLAMFLGLIFSVYIAIQQFPVYKRLLRDWIKWPSTEASYAKLLQGKITFADFRHILGALFPSGDRMLYFLQVEWRYGILFFGLVALAGLILFFWDKQRKIFSPDIRGIIGVTAFLSFPFFGAFLSPQVSADHPWMLRRFFFVVLPCGILAAIILTKAWMGKKSRRLSPTFAPLLLAILVIPSLSASAYFLSVKTDSGREAVLNQLGSYFEDDSYVFLNREASGDGWHMWAGPLSSIYGKNAVYVYSPDNLVNSRQLIQQRFSEGKKNYIILQENTFNFEHELGKHFNLALDREIDFTNLQLAIENGSNDPDFPPLINQSCKTKIYFLIPK
jgi:hypothetical protein